MHERQRCCFHRTGHPGRRGPRHRGGAGRLADAALARGMARVFLQVEAGNTAAQALYRRAGFETARSYVYWRHA
ncbi:GNAT family N-acetyltransferase [Polaromonas sp. AER18D-145]|uniref:GNAT family N-acetyltransferase n=1 Tax=Polaromonas sp. AER18D-145 TaxID=1977060 RepID=UPI00352AEAAA